MKHISRIIVSLILLLCVREAWSQDKGSDYDQYIQIAQGVDCQEIKLDETAVGGKVVYKKICFYDVIIDNTKHITMWHSIDDKSYGFLNK